MTGSLVRIMTSSCTDMDDDLLRYRVLVRIARPKGCKDALAWFKSLTEPIVTSDYVVDETLTLLHMRNERDKALQFGEKVIVGSAATIHLLSHEQFNRTWIFFQQASRLGLSFTDCSTHVVCQDLGIKRIAAFDRHFSTTGNFELVP
jgi:uncharacterized protein